MLKKKGWISDNTLETIIWNNSHGDNIIKIYKYI